MLSPQQEYETAQRVYDALPEAERERINRQCKTALQSRIDARLYNFPFDTYRIALGLSDRGEVWMFATLLLGEVVKRDGIPLMRVCIVQGLPGSWPTFVPLVPNQVH